MPTNDHGALARSTTRPPHGPRRASARHRRRIAGPLAVVLAVVLLAAACGSSDRGDEAEGEGSATTEATGASEASFGDLPSPCGPGDASGATDQGVTDTAITIGYGDDAGYAPAPGLNGELTDAMEAMIAWCNDQGGINGREVVGRYYDAAVTEVVNAMTQACGEVFFLVGQGWVFDSGQEQVRRGCDLPSVPGYAVSPQFTNAPGVYQPVPNPVDVISVQMAKAMADLFPEQVKKASVLYADYAPTRDSKDKVVQSFTQFGFEFLDCPVVYGIAGEADWRPLAQALKDCGAEAVYFAGSPYPNFQNYLQAADQVGYHPIYVTDANNYDETLAAWNVNGWGDDVYIRQTFTPLFEADHAPAVQQYIDIVEASGGEVNQLGEQAASAFLLWATAAKACGSELTRACVLDQLAQVEGWTGGGLHAAGDPGTNMPTECGLVLKLEGTGFERVTPEEPGSFDCDPAYVVDVTGPVVDQANLDADRVSQLG